MALLSDVEIDERLSGLPGWERRGGAISKSFECGDFVGSVRFAEALVEPAEAINHHPDLAISWSTVTVTISTHSEGGLTAADFELAGRIESLASAD
jgi:4a-hydroxytetrahydrobiopterin dehydratase